MKYLVQIGRATVLFHSRESAGRMLDITAQGVLVHATDWQNKLYAEFSPDDADSEVSMKSISDAAFSGAEDAGAKLAYTAVAEMQTKLDELRSASYEKDRQIKERQKELDAAVKMIAELQAAIAPPPPPVDESEFEKVPDFN